MKPATASPSPHLSDLSQCFLFYAEKLWTRATGGLKGVPLSRMGGGIDDKEVFAESLRRHQQANKCGSFSAQRNTEKSGAVGEEGGGGAGRGALGGGFPASVLLKDADACEEFFRHNDRWAARDDAIWCVWGGGAMGRGCHAGWMGPARGQLDWLGAGAGAGVNVGVLFQS